MRKLFVLVLFYLFNLLRVSSAPVIKASGVQWSEPKGNGKGNITLIMIPQNNSANDESDMIVAIKSDYQVLSQDTQLLNLVVNEDVNDKNGKSKFEKDSDAIKNCRKDFVKETVKNGVKCPNTAKYFESENELPSDVKNSTVDLSTNLIMNNQNKVALKEPLNLLDTTTINIFKLLGEPEINIGEKLNYDALNVNKDSQVVPLSTESTINIFSLLGVTNSNKETLTTNLPELVEMKSTDITPRGVNPKDPFFSQALTIIEKLKQDPSYFDKNEQRNANIINGLEGSREKVDQEIIQPKTKPLIGDDVVMNLDNGEIIPKEFGNAGISLNENSNVVEDSPVNNCTTSTTTCLPLSVANVPQPTPTVKENTEQSTSSVASLNLGIVTGVEQNGESKSVYTSSSQSDASFEDISIAPQAGKQQTVTQGFLNLSQSGASSPADICTTIIVQCSSTTNNRVFDQISEMVDAGSKISERLSSGESGTNHVGGGKESSGFITQCFTISNTDIMQTVKPQAGKQALPKKITLEPPINCETFLKTQEQSTTSVNVRESEAHLSRELAIPLVESSVLLANNNDISKGKDIPIVLNTSLDEINLSEFQEGNDKHQGKVAELYNNNPLVLSLDKKSPFVPPKPYVLKSGKRKIILLNSDHDKDMLFGNDINKIMNMHFAGGNLILGKNPSYRLGKNENRCENTTERFKEPTNFEMEPDEEESTEPSFETKQHLTTKEKVITIPEQDKNEMTLSQNKITTTKGVTLASTQDLDQKKEIVTTSKPLTKPTERSDASEIQKTSMRIQGITSSESFTFEAEPVTQVDFLPSETTYQEDTETTRAYYDKGSKTSHVKTTVTTEKIYSSEILEEDNKRSSTRKLTSPRVQFTMSTKKDSVTQGKTTTKKPYFTKVTEMTEEESNREDVISTEKECMSQVRTTTKPSYSKDTDENGELNLETTLGRGNIKTLKPYSTTIADGEETLYTKGADENDEHDSESSLSDAKTKKLKLYSTSSSDEEGTTTSCKKRYTTISSFNTEPTKPTSGSTKRKQVKDESCNKNMYIPANSVQEIIIQIIRSTKKPRKGEKMNSNTCINNEDETQNMFDSIKSQEKINYVPQKISAVMIKSIGGDVEPDNSRIAIQNPKEKTAKSFNNGKQSKIEQSKSNENMFSVSENKNIISNQTDFSRNIFYEPKKKSNNGMEEQGSSKIPVKNLKEYNSNPVKNDKQFKIKQSSSADNLYHMVDNKQVLSNKIDYDRHIFYQPREHFSILRTPRFTIQYKDKGLACNILKLLKADDKKIIKT